MANPGQLILHVPLHPAALQVQGRLLGGTGGWAVHRLPGHFWACRGSRLTAVPPTARCGPALGSCHSRAVDAVPTAAPGSRNTRAARSAPACSARLPGWLLKQRHTQGPAPTQACLSYPSSPPCTTVYLLHVRIFFTLVPTHCHFLLHLSRWLGRFDPHNNL